MNYCPKVSIIIPVYNGSNFLKEAIDSALAQTYPNCEIIVVNDGSTDDGASERIALGYGERIRYFSKENGGVSSALNFAFSQMKGEWFSWLSHDDLYYPEKIEKQIRFINELMVENPDIDLDKITVRSATVSIDKFGKIIKIPRYSDVPRHENPIDTILNNVYNYRLSGCSFLLPAACIKDVGVFREDIRTVSDVEYWYRLLFAGYEFYCLSNDRLVKNRSHGKQVGKTKVDLFNRELNDLFIWIADELDKLDNCSRTSCFERYYFALAKRRCKAAGEYVRKKYLATNQAPFCTRAKISIVAAFFASSGILRGIVRYIYRKIFVK